MSNVSRRAFLQKVGLGATAVAFSNQVPALEAYPSAPYEGKKMNIALVGLGNYARYLAQGLQETQYCRLTGIVTGTPSKAEEWQKKYDLPAANVYNYQNFDRIAENKDIDVVYVVLPNALHKEYAIRAAQAGKHVIVEKPMAVTEKDCMAMIAACQKAGVQLAVGYRLHYEPYHKELMRLGQEKVFGAVRLIEVSLGYRTRNPNEWRVKKDLAGGGPLMNIGVYCVQAGRYILGEEPTAVTAQFGPIVHPDIFKEVEESLTWQLQFPSGAVCVSSSTYNAQIDRLYAACDQGSFELTPAVSYGPFRGKTSNGELNFPTINQQAAQMDGICKILLEGKSLPAHITGEEGLKDVRVMQAIYKAARTGKRVQIRP